jgi:hypothetical protein
MNVKTNVRAGKGGSNSNSKQKGRSGGSDDSVHVEDVYTPPVSRCVGL